MLDLEPRVARELELELLARALLRAVALAGLPHWSACQGLEAEGLANALLGHGIRWTERGTPVATRATQGSSLAFRWGSKGAARNPQVGRPRPA